MVGEVENKANTAPVQVGVQVGAELGKNDGDLDEFRLPLGWQGSCSSTSSSKELGRNGNIRNFNVFRLPLGGS